MCLHPVQCRYFDVEEKYVKLTHEHFCLWPEGAAKLIDENTIGELPPSLSYPCCAEMPVLHLPPCHQMVCPYKNLFQTLPPACGRQK